MELFTNPLCPYAHRVRLVLAEKGVAASFVDVDPRNRPRGVPAVPTLRIGDRVLTESCVIAEFLEEAHPEPALLPRDPWQRATARRWIRFADERLYAHTRGLLYAAPVGDRPALLEQIHADLREMEAGVSVSGPYWLGAQYSLVDATYLPWFEQRAAIERFRGFAWPEGCPALTRWYAAAARRPAAQVAGKSEEFYLRAYSALGG